MRKDITVKEVCELTGLTKKLLYDYEEIGLVKPTGHTHREYENCNGHFFRGHKLYDEESLSKLRQIALFRELGFKRSEIQEIITAPDYDSNETLNKLSDLLKKQKEEIDAKILLVEQLKVIGIKNNILEYFVPISLSSIQDNQKKFENSYIGKKMKGLLEILDDPLNKELDQFFESMPKLNEEGSPEDIKNSVQKLFDYFIEALGICGYFVFVTIFLLSEGGGSFIEDITISSEIHNVVKLFLEQNSENHIQDLADLLVKYFDIIGMEFSDPKVKSFVNDAKPLFKRYYGTSNDEELKSFITLKNIKPFEKGGSYESYIYNAIIYWLENKETL